MNNEASALQQPVGRLSGRRVLIVEDEVIVAFNMECEIEDAGGAVVGPAYSVAEAQRLIEAVDAAILDININGEQVWPICDLLQSRDIPFVFASANCLDPNAVPAAYAATACFDKPVSMNRIIAKLSELTGAAG